MSDPVVEPVVDPAHEELTRPWRQHRPPGPLLPHELKTVHGGGGAGAGAGDRQIVLASITKR
ncbi:hypothetical protein [Streptomyces sp. NPDC092307]|uniref:hypothetical protein n=1 Tax=Streptomyces sp. NPDC092307 TaxID=3366013 RepID=UPI003821A14C